MAQSADPALKVLSDAVLAVTAERSVDEVLQRLVDAARELVQVRYAALGVPDAFGGFRRFLVSGMSDELISSLGPLPRRHGALGAMLKRRTPFVTDDIHQAPYFIGDWPEGHPDMHAFLGVPIIAEGEVIGAFYLTEKQDGEPFTDNDRDLTELLAAHAAIAITNARLHERSRELSILSERNRLASELHDVVSQKLFSLNLAAETASTLLERNDAAVSGQLQRVQELTREALDELRSLILGLRPANVERDGWHHALSQEAAMIRRVHGLDVQLRSERRSEACLKGALGVAAFRIVVEALYNAVRHAAPERIIVTVSGEPGTVRVGVADNGRGFNPHDPDLRVKHLGLTSMEERARDVGGTLEVRSAPGAGTTVSLVIKRNSGAMSSFTND